ncbi:MAG TPA: M1 family metallopeptidase [Anaerolineales bacterium]
MGLSRRFQPLMLLLVASLHLAACSLASSQGDSQSNFQPTSPASTQISPPSSPSQTLEQTNVSPGPGQAPTSQPSNPTAIAPASPGVLAACSLQDQATAMMDAQIPDWGSLGLSTCYDLTLDLDLEPNGYSGAARITYTNLTGVALADLVLRTYPNAERIYAGRLEISAAGVNGEPVKMEVFLPDGTAVRLLLPDSLAAGDSAVIDLEFSGEFTRNFGQFGAYGVFNYVSAEEVLTLANWYPMVAPWIDGDWDADAVIGIGDAVVSETSLYQVRVSAPAGWQIVTTGSSILQEQIDGNMRETFVSGPARDFIVSASPNFVLSEARADGVLIRHWGLADGEDRWDEALQTTVNALTLFNQRFGIYPYTELDVVQVPLQLAAGVEYPGVFLIGDSQYEANAESPFLLGIVVSHEAAHQWWYGVVGNDVLDDPWQDEALATFSSLLYQQEHQPGVYPGTLRFYRERVSELDAAPNDAAVDQSLEAFRKRPELYSPIVYTKGALFFVELRDRLGDEAFFGALQAYYASNQYKIAAPGELLSAFESACSCELDEFYAEWGIRASDQ